MNLKNYILALVTLVALCRAGIAHTVWIEPINDQMVIRFAEPGSRFEKSPGHLDSLTPPVSFKVVTNAPVLIDSPKRTDHFALVGAPRGEVICTESIFTVRTERKPYFYARWNPEGAGAGTPLLTLDLVPTGTAGEVRAYFRGQPLGQSRAILRTPDEKEKELTSDAEGFIRFKTEQRGFYLLTIPHHRENLAGFHLGKPYRQASHNTALSWIQR